MRLRSLGLLAATAVSATTLLAAPQAVATDTPRVEQSVSEPGKVRPRTAKRPLTPRTRRVVAPVLAPRVALAPVTAPVPTAAPPAVLPQPVEAVTPTQPAAPVETATAGPHSFLNVDNGVVTRWNPCQPVPWQFNPAGAPAGALEALHAAMATLAEKTGLRLEYQGTATTAPSAAYLTQSWGAFRPLLVGWSSPQDSDLLAGGDASLVGMARILWTGSYDAQGRNHTQIASGVVALNRTTSAGTSGAGSWYTFLLHELGHAVGLGHVNDSEQLMRASIPTHLPTYGSGDLQGLRAVGSAGGCLPNIR